MSIIFNGVGGCQEWRISAIGSRTWTCTVALILPPHAGNLANLTDSELIGVLHHYLPPGAAPPEDGVYFITAKMATRSPAMVVGEGYTAEGFDFELDCLVMLPQELRKHDILPVPYISTAKKVAHLTCFFSEDGRFIKSVPRLNHGSFVHVTGVVTGVALPRQGSAADRLSIRILDLDFLSMASGVAPSPAPITPGKKSAFQWSQPSTGAPSHAPPIPQSPTPSGSLSQGSLQRIADDSSEQTVEEDATLDGQQNTSDATAGHPRKKSRRA
ncbi:hypothetical protein CALCODRAFT_479899 [Calocera cornea HHB12733]|uniref:Uncharacterized protein n=1 Tax=Calocera cornea HHB12733 TaxID=1353952 RepID=A0A165J5F3_9BASI|nr:hypothetical protein CALCODRAFT_479899 [Calocera cornea HHB12733]